MYFKPKSGVLLWKRDLITLFNEGKDIDYWSPSSFHNGPPTIKVIKCID